MNNNNIVLTALQSQLETIRTSAVEHEQNVYEPAVAKLTDKIKKYFETYIVEGLHNIVVTSDCIRIFPSDIETYGNDITIYYRSSWQKENGYFETSSYRPDLDSRESNDITIKYYKAMSAIASAFTLICNEYKTKWMPVFDKLKAAKDEKYSEIYNIEREIRRVENEIAETAKQAYCQSGFECTLKPYANYESNYDNNETAYTKKFTEHNIRLLYGRGRWDYYYINSFKVISFPKAKHGKVVIEYQQGGTSDDKKRTVEVNKTRYAEFVTEVYHWQTSGAESREEDIDERITRWSKADA